CRGPASRPVAHSDWEQRVIFLDPCDAVVRRDEDAKAPGSPPSTHPNVKRTRIRTIEQVSRSTDVVPRHDAYSMAPCHVDSAATQVRDELLDVLWGDCIPGIR